MIEERVTSLQGMLGSSKKRKGNESEASYRRRQNFASPSTIDLEVPQIGTI
jgi:hypothetical protein